MRSDLAKDPQLNRELDDTNRGVVALHAELDERADYLRRASELKTRFLSNMTHEFRTPLNSILSLVHMLQTRQDGELNEEQDRQLGFIRRSAQSLSELVDDLLDLAKVEAGKLSVRPARLDVGELFNTLRGILRPLVDSSGAVRLVFEDADEFGEMITDESKVSQILRNFVSNGLKFTEKGEVRVRVRAEPENHVTFEVIDTGIGIAPEDVSRIFEEFVQIEGSHQQRFRGTGLGLSLTRRLAELLGGEVGVSSQAGLGSTFRVTLPREYAGEPQDQRVLPFTRETLDPLRHPVLVVEDNKEVLYIYERFFKGTRFQLVPAHSVRDARQRMMTIRPLAVMLDILLDGVSSWPLLEDLKGSATTREITVFVVTVIENQEKALALGADDFHLKPLDREWLLERLERLALAARPEEILVVDDDEAARYIVLLIQEHPTRLPKA